MRTAIVICALVLAGTTVGSVSEPRFFDDDPLPREPETQDASGAVSREVSLVWDTLYSLFIVKRREATKTRAMDVSTIDEVLDSGWFTNRASARRLTAEEVERGPDTTSGPAAGTWTVTSGKSDGIMPGFTIRDSAGIRWFLKFDSPDYPELATGAEVVSTKLFWALGYHVPENHIATLRPADLRIDPKATIKDAHGRKHPMTQADVDRLLGQAARRLDGTYRVLASRALDGSVLGPFLYFGTRSDDPNDIVPHEDRRSLRALRVFAAWLNHVDVKSINTLDTLVRAGGRRVVRHHLLDFGSTLGSAGTGPRDFEEGHEYLYEGKPLLKTALTAGLLVPSWRRIEYEAPRAIGRFDAPSFDPLAWKPRIPNAAFERAMPEDLFWAARTLARLDPDAIAGAVRAGRYTDPAAQQYLLGSLRRRRRAVLEAYLAAVNPIVEPSLSDEGLLRFVNAAEEHDVAARPPAYLARWYVYDNVAGKDTPLGTCDACEPALFSPVALPRSEGAIVHVAVRGDAATPAPWQSPVHLFFRRTNGAWRLIGLERGRSDGAQATS